MLREASPQSDASRKPNAVETIDDCGWASEVSGESLDLKNCTATWVLCMKHICRWRVPPRWLMGDWFEEMQAECVVAVLEALIEFDPSYNVPLRNFIGMRIRSRAIARYRKEWSYSLHQILDEVQEKGVEEPIDVELALKIDLRSGLSRLSPIDRFIIERIFWHGETETEVAHTLQKSQQWINKRKNVAIGQLRKLLNA